MILRIGLTGGIGSGKTMVCKIFEKLGVPVYYADAAAKHIMNNDPLVKTQIIDLFGAEAYTSNGLNRPYISSVVFKNKEMLGALNAIVHPATISASDRWMQAQTTPYAIKEAALIFESGIPQALDYIIGVTAPLDLRVLRVMQRDGLKKDEVTGRMKNQMNEEEKMKLCDFVIVNDEQQPVIPQVLHIHNRLNGIFLQNMRS